MSLNPKALLSIARNAISDLYGRVAAIDPMSWHLATITTEHHEIHEGNHYNYADYSLGVASGGTVEFVVNVPDVDGILPHLGFGIYSSTGAKLELFVGATGVVGGDVVTPRNNFPGSGKSSILNVIKDPTSIASDGVRTSGFLAGAGRNAGFASREKEVILSPNINYLLRITSTAASNNISWDFEWYEIANKG